METFILDFKNSFNVQYQIFNFPLCLVDCKYYVDCALRGMNQLIDTVVISLQDYVTERIIQASKQT